MKSLTKNNVEWENRRVINVYPTLEEYSSIMKQLLLFNDSETIDGYIEKTYTRISLEYGSSFFRYARIGTIHAMNAQFLNEVIPLFERIAIANTQLDDAKRLGLSFSESSYYETDNTTDNNIDGYEVNKSIYKNTDFTDLDKINNKLLTLRIRLSQEFNRYQKYLLNDIIYYRGEIYGN